MRKVDPPPALVRWFLIRAIEAARPDGVTEVLLHRVLNGSDLPITPRDVRREIDFLELAGLVDIDRDDDSLWIVRPTHAGALFAQGCGPDVLGIDRPTGGL